jgi:hypothetical protein
MVNSSGEGILLFYMLDGDVPHFSFDFRPHSQEKRRSPAFSSHHEVSA